MRTVITISFLILAAAAAAQPLDPRPDGMGVYFDEGASEPCLPAPEIFSTYTAWLALTHPSADDVAQWYVRLVESDATARVGVWDLLGGIDPLPDDTWIVALPAPVATGGDVFPLARLDFVWAGGENRLRFVEIANGAYCGYRDSQDVYRECGLWTDDPGGDVAVMGSGDLCAPSPNEALTWGALKRLY